MVKALFRKYALAERYVVMQVSGKHIGRKGVIIGEYPSGLLVMQTETKGIKRQCDILPRSVRRIFNGEQAK